MDAGDTAFVLLSAALVLFMTPGLALFYGGMVRSKNVLATIMQSFMVIGLVTVVWVLWGYSLAFGPDINGFIGDLSWCGLKDVGLSPNEAYASTIPHQAFMIFQGMFAIVTPALISGAFAERLKFSTFVIFILLWSTLVYTPVAHWVWGAGGWLGSLGALDFAGGTVVHISSGASALAAVLLIPRRKGYGQEQFTPHNLPMTISGAAILWFGWFGFNAGSALASNGLAAAAFVNTHVAAAAAAVSWIVVEWLHRKKPTTLGAASGAVAGLVAITPAAGFVSPVAALIIGALAGAICYEGVLGKARLGYDDSLDVVGIHGLGGTWGALATGLFASTAVNPHGADGLFFGNPAQLWTQLISVAATIVYAFVMTLVIFKFLDVLLGLKVADEDEVRGLDVSQHSETAYNI
ncbi:MAG: ammonium transporter [Deltaproteobacteria bacterium]|nr:ammonium transporter [Deltaproteobacteria bacterium]MBW2070528.1 ammonium transporter [Deltaproteobacteria bacterium]